jgi:hypothetical protein
MLSGGTERIIYAIGVLLLLAELGWFASWIAFSAKDIADGTGVMDKNDPLNRAQTGFTALAAPHTALMPAVLAIVNDIRKSCTRRDRCALKTPAITWFTIPMLALPFDVLQYCFNRKYFNLHVGEPNAWPVRLSLYQVVNCLLIGTWSTLVYAAIFWNVRSANRRVVPAAVAARSSVYYRGQDQL